jgi:hypothetical protein
MPRFRIYLIQADQEAWKVPPYEVECETSPQGVDLGRQLLRSHDIGELWHGGNLISRFGPIKAIPAGRTSTYALRMGELDIWKVGHATDISASLAQMNSHPPFDGTSQPWVVFSHHAWASSQEAFGMELRLLQMLAPRRSGNGRIDCPESELKLAWGACLAAMGRGESLSEAAT